MRSDCEIVVFFFTPNPAQRVRGPYCCDELKAKDLAANARETRES